MKISFQQFRSIWIDQLSAHHPVFDNQPLLPVLSEEATANGQWSDRLLSRDTRAGDAISSRVYIILTAAEMMLSLRFLVETQVTSVIF